MYNKYTQHTFPFKVLVLIKGFTAITAASTNLATYDDDDDNDIFIHDVDDDDA